MKILGEIINCPISSLEDVELPRVHVLRSTPSDLRYVEPIMHTFIDELHQACETENFNISEDSLEVVFNNDRVFLIYKYRLALSEVDFDEDT